MQFSKNLYYYLQVSKYYLQAYEPLPFIDEYTYVLCSEISTACFFHFTGYSIPLGMLEETVTMNDKLFYHYPAYTEYIVEDPRQVCLKYLVQFTKGSAK